MPRVELPGKFPGLLKRHIVPRRPGDAAEAGCLAGIHLQPHARVIVCVLAAVQQEDVLGPGGDGAPQPTYHIRSVQAVRHLLVDDDNPALLQDGLQPAN